MEFKRTSDVLILLPTYNERDTLPLVLENIRRHAQHVDICVLDDASPDGTGELAETWAQQDPKIKVVHRPSKKGLGPAYVDGFRRALAMSYGTVVHMDADGSHPASALARMFALIQQHDVVLGSRWIEGGGTERWPWYRRAVSRIGSWYARRVLGVSIRDVTGGFKCFSRKALEALPLDSIQTTGYAFQIETTYRLLKKGFSVVETPIVFTEREQGYSKMTWKIILEAVISLPLLRWKVAQELHGAKESSSARKPSKSLSQSPSK